MKIIAPNQTLVTATVTSISDYPEQPDFHLVQLHILESRALPMYIQMPGAEKGKDVSALLSRLMAIELGIAKDVLLECEIQKISINLWRIDFIITKGAH